MEYQPIRDIVKERLSFLLDQKDRILEELEELEDLLDDNVYEQLVREVTSTITIIQD